MISEWHRVGHPPIIVVSLKSDFRDSIKLTGHIVITEPRTTNAFPSSDHASHMLTKTIAQLEEK